MELGGIFLGGGVIFRELSGAAGTGDPKFLSLPWDVPGGKGNSHCRFSSLQLGAFIDPKILSFPWIKVEPGCAWIKVEPGCTWMPKFLSLPWDVPEGKGNFHFRRPPKSLSIPYPWDVPGEKGNSHSPEPHLARGKRRRSGNDEAARAVAAWNWEIGAAATPGAWRRWENPQETAQTFPEKNQEGLMCQKSPFPPNLPPAKLSGATKTLRNRSRKGESLPSVAVPLPRRTWSSSLGFSGMRKRLWMPG